MLDEFSDILEDLDTIEDVNSEKENEYLERLKEELNSSGYLVTDYDYKDRNISGQFDDDLWVFVDDNSKTHILFDFNSKEMEQLKFKGLKSSDITRFKIYIAYLLLDLELKPSTIKSNFTGILKFFKLTEFLSEEHVNGLDNIIKEQLKEYKNTDKVIKNIKIKNEEVKKNKILDKKADSFSFYAYRYINFLIEKLRVSEAIYIRYQQQLKVVNAKYHIGQESRSLPNSLDILNFHNYLDKFFNDTNIPKELKLLYRPIQIWWKLTNIIPMRPTEYCTKLLRDCLLKKEEDGEYYIKINRVKERNSNRFPVKKEFRLDKELAEIMLEYIDDTNDFGHTETLFSYRGVDYLRKEVQKLGHATQSALGQKNDPNYFTRGNFANLLDSFYEVVIHQLFKDSSYTRQINPGDTRHFAFFSLLMQGLSPVEIALLGGHSTLEMQVNYQNCIEYYIGTELYEFLECKDTKKIKKKISKTLNNIINSLPTKCPKPLDERLPLKIGYCLCDFSKDVCDNVDDFCCFCTKWWGEPTRNTFNKWKLEIEKEIKQLDGNIFFKLSALEELLSKNYQSKTLKGTNVDAYVDTKTTLNQIKSDCNKIIGMKFSIISEDFINQLKNVKPKELLNEYSSR